MWRALSWLWQSSKLPGLLTASRLRQYFQRARTRYKRVPDPLVGIKGRAINDLSFIMSRYVPRHLCRRKRPRQSWNVVVWRLSSGKGSRHRRPWFKLVLSGNLRSPAENLFVFFALTPEYRLYFQQRSPDPGFDGVYRYSSPF